MSNTQLLGIFSNPSRSAYAAVMVFSCSLFAAGAETAPDQLASWRLELANDSLVGSDNQFTSGISIQKHSRTVSSLDATSGTPAFGKGLARLFLPDNPELLYREAWAIGQNLQAPENIEREDIILDDVPYVGMFGWENSYIAFNDQKFTGFQILLGWVGEEVQGEQAQTLVHKVIGDEEPSPKAGTTSSTANRCSIFITSRSTNCGENPASTVQSVMMPRWEISSPLVR